MSRKVLWAGILVLLAGSLLSSPARACEVCDWGITVHLANNAYCRSADPNEVGSTHCTLTYDPLTPSVDCYESGSFCTTITVTGGGGGTGGGGTGGGGCGGSGFCPASCFSCGGGGAQI